MGKKRKISNLFEESNALKSDSIYHDMYTLEGLIKFSKGFFLLQQHKNASLNVNKNPDFMREKGEI